MCLQSTEKEGNRLSMNCINLKESSSTQMHHSKSSYFQCWAVNGLSHLIDYGGISTQQPEALAASWGLQSPPQTMQGYLLMHCSTAGALQEFWGMQVLDWKEIQFRGYKTKHKLKEASLICIDTSMLYFSVKKSCSSGLNLLSKRIWCKTQLMHIMSFVEPTKNNMQRQNRFTVYWI